MIDLTPLENFIGYGRADAPVIFIGIEEEIATDVDSTKARAALDTHLKRRLKFAPVEDLFEAQRVMKGRAYKAPVQSKKVQRTWRMMAWLMIAARGEKPVTEMLTAYENERLGRAIGDTLLVDFFPFPATSWFWPYDDEKQFTPTYPNRERYEVATTPGRLKLLSTAFAASTRNVIVAHGKERWPLYKRIFSKTRWTDSGIFRYADIGPTRIVLAPNFAGRAMNGAEPQLYALLEKHLAAAVRTDE